MCFFRKISNVVTSLLIFKSPLSVCPEYISNRMLSGGCWVASNDELRDSCLYECRLDCNLTRGLDDRLSIGDDG